MDNGMGNLYEPPVSDPEIQTDLDLKPRFRKLAVLGTLFLAGPLIGRLVTLLSMINSFSTLSNGNADPAALASDINSALVATLIGIALGLVGVVLVSLALFQRKNREPWFFRNVVVLSILWCILVFPLGIIVGIYLLIVFLTRKHEFSSKALN